MMKIAQDHHHQQPWVCYTEPGHTGMDKSHLYTLLQPIE